MTTTRFSTVKQAGKLETGSKLTELKNTLNTSSIWRNNITTTETNGQVSYTYTYNKTNGANSIVTMIKNLETQENKMRTYQFTKTDGSAGNQVKDTDVNNKLDEIKTQVDGIKKLGRAVPEEQITKFFKDKPSNQNYDLSNENDVVRVNQRIEHCKNIEKAYIKKHVELYILSKICKDLYTNMNKNMEYYAKLRTIKINDQTCDNGSDNPQDPGYKPGKHIQIRLPQFLDPETMQKKQDEVLDKVKFVSDPFKIAYKNVPKVGGGGIRQILTGRSNTNIVRFNTRRYHPAFKNFDSLMNVKTTDNEKKTASGGVATSSNDSSTEITVERVNNDYQTNITAWNNVLNDYRTTIKKQFKIEINENAPDYKALLKNVNKYTDTTKNYKEIKTKSKTGELGAVAWNDTEDRQKYESYFLRCHSYEYLYIKKHEEFMELYKFVLYLIIHYTYTYIILTLYINVLQKVSIECVGTGLAPWSTRPKNVKSDGTKTDANLKKLTSIIPDPQALVKNQDNIMNSVNATIDTLKKNVTNATNATIQQGGNPSQIGGSQSIKNLLDILLKLVNIIKDTDSASLGSGNSRVKPNTSLKSEDGMTESDDQNKSAEPSSLTSIAGKLLGNITTMFNSSGTTFKNVNQKEDKIKL